MWDFRVAAWYGRRNAESLTVFLVFFAFGAQERVFISGNSTHNFVEIMRSPLDFDIRCCTNSKLFIFKAAVNKRLLKFERATEKVLELKREILESFQGRPRAKRLFNAGDERWEQSKASVIQNVPVPPTIRAKASKSLQFSAAKMFVQNLPLVFLLLTIIRDSWLI